MEVLKLTFSTLAGSASTNGDLYTAAKAGWVVNSASTAYLYVEEKATSAKVFTGLDPVAGTGTPAVNVQPAFYPVATKGAECGAIVSNLSWADDNLLEGYEYCQLVTTTGSERWFVSGVLNSSQTLANDPFDSTTYPEIVKGACWSGAYVAGQNPFA